MRLGAVLMTMSLVGSPSFASKNLPADLFGAKPVEISTDELLSMPAQNRKMIGMRRGAEFLKDLEQRSFDLEENFSTRWKAFILSAQILGPKADRFLEKGLNSKDWFMRNAALLAATEVNPRKARMMAVDLLQDKALVVRAAAVRVLSSKMTDEDREALWDQLDRPVNFRKNRGLFIREQILKALAVDPLEKEYAQFVRHLKADDPRLHQASISALEQITAHKMGSAKDTLNQKRDLWIKWASAPKADKN